MIITTLKSDNSISIDGRIYGNNFYVVETTDAGCTLKFPNEIIIVRLATAEVDGVTFTDSSELATTLNKASATLTVSSGGGGGGSGGGGDVDVSALNKETTQNAIKTILTTIKNDNLTATSFNTTANNLSKETTQGEIKTLITEIKDALITELELSNMLTSLSKETTQSDIKTLVTTLVNNDVTDTKLKTILTDLNLSTSTIQTELKNIINNISSKLDSHNLESTQVDIHNTIKELNTKVDSLSKDSSLANIKLVIDNILTKINEINKESTQLDIKNKLDSIKTDIIDKNTELTNSINAKLDLINKESTQSDIKTLVNSVNSTVASLNKESTQSEVKSKLSDIHLRLDSLNKEVTQGEIKGLVSDIKTTLSGVSTETTVSDIKTNTANISAKLDGLNKESTQQTLVTKLTELKDDLTNLNKETTQSAIKTKIDTIANNIVNDILPKIDLLAKDTTLSSVLTLLNSLSKEETTGKIYTELFNYIKTIYDANTTTGSNIQLDAHAILNELKTTIKNSIASIDNKVLTKEQLVDGVTNYFIDAEMKLLKESIKYIGPAIVIVPDYLYDIKTNYNRALVRFKNLRTNQIVYTVFDRLNRNLKSLESYIIDISKDKIDDDFEVTAFSDYQQVKSNTYMLEKTPNITYTGWNGAICSVATSGLVTALAVGTTTVNVTYTGIDTIKVVTIEVLKDAITNKLYINNVFAPPTDVEKELETYNMILGSIRRFASIPDKFVPASRRGFKTVNLNAGGSIIINNSYISDIKTNIIYPTQISITNLSSTDPVELIANNNKLAPNTTKTYSSNYRQRFSIAIFNKSAVAISVLLEYEYI